MKPITSLYYEERKGAAKTFQNAIELRRSAALNAMAKAIEYACQSDLETEWANELAAIEYLWLQGLIVEEEYMALLGAVFSEIARDRSKSTIWADETAAEFYYFSA